MAAVSAPDPPHPGHDELPRIEMLQEKIAYGARSHLRTGGDAVVQAALSDPALEPAHHDSDARAGRPVHLRDDEPGPVLEQHGLL